MGAVRSVLSLLIGTALVLVANGLLTTVLGTRLAVGGQSLGLAGVVVSAFSVGLVGRVSGGARVRHRRELFGDRELAERAQQQRRAGADARRLRGDVSGGARGGTAPGRRATADGLQALHPGGAPVRARAGADRPDAHAPAGLDRGASRELGGRVAAGARRGRWLLRRRVHDWFAPQPGARLRYGGGLVLRAGGGVHGVLRPRGAGAAVARGVARRSDRSAGRHRA